MSRLGLLVVLSLACGLAFSSGAQEPASDDYRLRVDVDLVMVPANVTTADGRPVTSLGRQDFQVLEDGQPRPLKVFEKKTQLPLQLVLLVDASLSAASHLEQEKQAMARFVQRVLRPQDAAALFAFSGDNRSLLDFTSDVRKIDEGLRKIEPAAGTALYDTLVDVADRLQERPGRRVLVLITDGNDTTSTMDFHDAARALQGADATVFGLIVRPIPGESGRSVRGEHVLMSYARMTGGRVFFADQAAQLDRSFQELSELLRTQYLLGFQPLPPGRRTEFRPIEVRINRGEEFVVLHRAGYYAEPRP